MKLKTILKALPEDSLLNICAFWGLKPPPPDDKTDSKSALIEHLTMRMQLAQYFRTAYDKLAPAEQDTIRFLAIHGGELSLMELRERMFDGSEKSCFKAIDNLERTGFVCVDSTDPDIDDPLVGLPDVFLRFIETPQHLQYFLGSMLQQMTPSQLGELHHNIFGAVPTTVKRHVLVFKLRNFILDPVQLSRYLSGLSDTEQEMFGKLTQRKGFALYRDLLDLDNLRRLDHSRAEHLNNLIGQRGIVYTINEGQNKYTNLLCMPRDVLQIVDNDYQPDLRSMEELDLVASADEGAPGTVLENSNALLRDIVLLAGLINRADMKVLANGGVSRNDLKKTISQLSSNKTLRYAVFLSEYLIGAGHLVDVEGLWRLSDSFVKWLRNPRQCYRDAYDWWLHCSVWNESSPAGEVAEAPRNWKPQFDIVQLRRLVLQGIANLPDQRWIEFESFFETVKPQIATDFPGSSEGRAGLKVREIMKRAAEVIVMESLYWMGPLVVGYNGGPPEYLAQEVATPKGRRGAAAAASRTDSPRQTEEIKFRKSTLGEAIFEEHFLEPDDLFAQLTPETKVLQYAANWALLQPNLEVMAPPDMLLEKLLVLVDLAEIRNTDVMTTFEFTADSIRNALERGFPPDAMTSFLKTLSRTGVPETLDHLIRDCADRHGEARLGSAGGYIALDDEVMLEAVRNSNKLLPFVKDIIGKNVVILAPDTDLNKVSKELRALGFMPRLEADAVHETSDRFHLSLSPADFYNVIACVRLVALMDEEFEGGISSGEAAALSKILKPESATFLSFNDLSETTSAAYEKKFFDALKERIRTVEDKYKSQVSRLVTKSIRGRGPTKFHYRGTNPALEREDILAMLQFAREHELEVKMLYLKQGSNEATLTILPKGFEGSRVYAHCMDTDSDGMYSLERMLRAELV